MRVCTKSPSYTFQSALLPTDSSKAIVSLIWCLSPPINWFKLFWNSRKFHLVLYTLYRRHYVFSTSYNIFARFDMTTVMNIQRWHIMMYEIGLGTGVFILFMVSPATCRLNWNTCNLSTTDIWCSFALSPVIKYQLQPRATLNYELREFNNTRVVL